MNHNKQSGLFQPKLTHLDKQVLTDQARHSYATGDILELATGYKPGSPFTQATYVRNPTADQLIDYASRYGDIAILAGLSHKKLEEAYTPALEKIKKNEDQKGIAMNKRWSEKLPGQFILGERSPRLGSAQTMDFRTDLFLDIDLNGFLEKNYNNLCADDKKNRFLEHAADITKYLRIPPWYVLIGKGGLHIAYKLNTPLVVAPQLYSRIYEYFAAAIEKELDHQYKFDLSCKNFARLRRLPGSSNFKDPKNPIKTEVYYFSPDGFGDPLIEEVRKKVQNVKCKPAKRENPGSITRDKKDKLSDFCNTFSCMEGERHKNCFKLITDLVSLGIESELVLKEVEKFVERANAETSNPFSLDEATRILESILSRHQLHPYTISRRAKNFFYSDDDNVKMSAADIAMEFTQSYPLEIDLVESSPIVYWAFQFYMLDGSNWQAIPKKYLEGLIAKFMIEEGLKDFIKRSFILDVIATLQGLNPISPDLPAPFYISKKLHFESLICLDEVVDLKKICNGDNKDSVSPITPDVFYLNKLSFKYNPTATRARWDKFLIEVLPCQNERELLQEFVGSILCPDLIHEHFLLIIGRGANGKSVIAFVIKLLIGRWNIASVSLENLDPKRTFPLAALENRLLNLVSDMGPIRGSAEGMLKTLVSGEQTLVERKHEQPRTVIFRAKHIFISNSLPSFSDISDGLARRAIIINFKKQFLDPQKANPNLKTENYWQDELPGILNWAIEGLTRLKRRGFLIVPNTSKEEFEELRREADFTGSFISDHFEPDSSNIAKSPSTFYRFYVNWCENSGHKPISQGAFVRAMKRSIPTITQATSPTSIGGGKRERMIYGVKQKI